MDGREKMTVRALPGTGDWIKSWYYGNRIRRVHHLEQPPGSPLGAEICKARVWGSGRRWWWECRCFDSGTGKTWAEAFRLAYRHVKMSWLLAQVSELERQEREEQDCGG